jgi:hypothetical protein
MAENNIEISLPLIFELSGLDVLLFGERYEISGHVIYVKDTISLTNFYSTDESGQPLTGWLKYMQDASENTFTTAINDLSCASLIREDVIASVHLSGGNIYDVANKDISNLDAGSIFNISGFNGHYANFQDFILGYFAWKLLGHPHAVAAIGNDSSIRASVTSGFTSAMGQLLDMSENKLNVIVQQIMDQDLARFAEDNVGEWNVVKWLAGDKVRLHISIKDNTYSLGTALGTHLPVSSGTDNYILELTLA